MIRKKNYDLIWGVGCRSNGGEGRSAYSGAAAARWLGRRRRWCSGGPPAWVRGRGDAAESGASGGGLGEAWGRWE
jgi:hypothetical protein